MTDYGVTPAGFVPKSLEIVQNEMIADLRGPDGIDPAIDTSPTQPLGQIVGAIARPIAEVWEIAQVVGQVLNPSAAEGTILENACGMTGTTRDGATYSLVTCTLNLSAGKSVAVGSVASVNGQPANRWLLLGPPDPVTGVAIPGPVVSVLAGNYPGVFRAESTGAQVANAGTLTTIVSSVSGWNSVTNATDAVVGQAVESDTHLRQKRRAELAAPGGCTPDALRAKLLKLPGMVEARVYENTGITVDADGRPPRVIEAVVYDAGAVLDQDIANTVWPNKAAGGATYGTTSKNVTDQIGISRPVLFTRATSVQMSVALSIQIDSSMFPADGVARIQAAIAAQGLKTCKVGTTAYPLTFQAALLATVPGIANITSYLHGPTGGGGATLSTPYAATIRQILLFDSSRVAVTVVP